MTKLPDLPIVPATAVPARALCNAFNAAFSDYLIGPPQLSEAQWPAFLRRQGAELPLSLAAQRDDGQVMAFALIGRFHDRFGLRTRVATMGARRDARGTGLAPRVLDEAIRQAAERGAPALELEVFAQNTIALRLYRSRGFEPVCELFGYEAAPRSRDDFPATQPAFQVTPDGALAWLRTRDVRDLPYQVSAGALETGGSTPPIAWRLGDAQLVFAARDAAHLSLASLVDTGPEQMDARLLLRALRGQYPAATLRVPQLQRMDLGGAALEAEGFTRLPLHQWLMRRAL
jgi:ribosomal protein S18 acetylase RimI-like enzyme